MFIGHNLPMTDAKTMPQNKQEIDLDNDLLLRRDIDFARYALRELVAQVEGAFFSLKHDHFSMTNARKAAKSLERHLKRIDETR